MLELALSLPLLLLFFFGVADLGRLFYTSITLVGAATAGAQYGVASTANNNDYAGMQQAALNDAVNLTGVTATAVQFCECLDGTSVSCSSGTCSSSSPPKYVKVTTQATFRTWFSYPAIPSSVPLSGVSVERAQ